MKERDMKRHFSFSLVDRLIWRLIFIILTFVFIEILILYVKPPFFFERAASSISEIQNFEDWRRFFSFFFIPLLLGIVSYRLMNNLKISFLSGLACYIITAIVTLFFRLASPLALMPFDSSLTGFLVFTFFQSIGIWLSLNPLKIILTYKKSTKITLPWWLNIVFSFSLFIFLLQFFSLLFIFPIFDALMLDYLATPVFLILTLLATLQSYFFFKSKLILTLQRTDKDVTN